jgi:hypothetical protein
MPRMCRHDDQEAACHSIRRPCVGRVGVEPGLAPSSRRRPGPAGRTGLGPGIYTSRTSAPPEETVRRNWAQILDHELPGPSSRIGWPAAVVPSTGSSPWSTRASDRWICRTIMPRPGSPALPGDTPLLSVRLVSRARAMLENLRGRSRDRYLSRAEIETWLADILVNEGTQTGPTWPAFACACRTGRPGSSRLVEIATCQPSLDAHGQQRGSLSVGRLRAQPDAVRREHGPYRLVSAGR